MPCFGCKRPCDRLCINHIVSGISGALFTIGWWCLIDAHCYYPSEMNQSRAYYVPGVIGTLALLMVNVVPSNILCITTSYYDKCSICWARGFLFFGFFLTFSALFGAFFIFIYYFAMHPDVSYMWIGVAVLLQNIFITAANFLFRLISNAYTIDLY